MSMTLENNRTALLEPVCYRERPLQVERITVYGSDSRNSLQWNRIFQKLREIGEYKFDWNDNEAEPLKSEVLSLAIGTAKILRLNHEPAPKRCLATDEGHIIFAWESESGYLELEIDRACGRTLRWLASGAQQSTSTTFVEFIQFS